MRVATRLGLLGSLYFAQGLPFGFFTQALPVLLRKSGTSLGAIGLSSLLALPWALKFLWAPVIDRRGTRRGWILTMQVATALLLAALAFMSGASLVTSMLPLLGASLLINLASATQDIATDGLAVDILSPRERGLANGIQVAGYRLGMIIGGGALLILFDRTGATETFALMAVLTIAVSLPILFAGGSPSPKLEVTLRAEPTELPPSFLRRPGARGIIAMLLAYKIGDAFATAMLRPYLADLGLSLADIGELLGTIGFTAGLAGALAGGALVNHLGRKNALLAFGALQALTVAAYAWLASTSGATGMTPPLPALQLITAAEHFAGGMATAALFTTMMDWCHPKTSAADYTIQASTVVIATGLASALSGFSARALGYFGHFVAAAFLAALALATTAYLFPATTRKE